MLGRPVMLATEIFDWALWRARPAGYHAQNLLWHAGVVLLFFANLRRWGFAPVAGAGGRGRCSPFTRWWSNRLS